MLPRKLISIVATIILLIGLEGCSMLTCQGDYVVVDKSTTAKVVVKTDPAGAEIFLNGKFVGKSPKKIIIHIPYQAKCGGMFFAVTGFSLHHVDEYKLSVVKEGYAKVEIPLQFKDAENLNMNLVKAKFDIKLTKRLQTELLESSPTNGKIDQDTVEGDGIHYQPYKGPSI